MVWFFSPLCRSFKDAWTGLMTMSGKLDLKSRIGVAVYVSGMGYALAPPVRRK